MDVFGIVYIIENAQQFWSELEDLVRMPPDPTLDMLDSALNRFVSFCASYHEQYLQTQLQIEHACEILLDSELFTWHSARMTDILLRDACKNTDPHLQLMIEHVLLAHGRRTPAFLRAQTRWQPLIPLLMDAAYVEIDEGITDFTGKGAPIEAKLLLLAIQLLYEVSRSQKLSIQELRIFDDHFIVHLFDLVEETRDLEDDDTFNYSVIKLIVALNEQFMVATMPAADPTSSKGSALPANAEDSPAESRNRVLKLLIRRMNSCRTFSENLIFMLNRASNRSTEDRCMQVLVLKLLYLLFTTPGTSEFFYTNDLCVLVDVFMRELVDLDESSESLRHTFLRVLHPLLTKTQLRVYPYKRLQIYRTLESLVANSDIHDVDPTTARLVARCLSGDWCIPVKSNSAPGASPLGPAIPTFEGSHGMTRHDTTRLGRRPSHKRAPSTSHRLKASRSVEDLKTTKTSPTPITPIAEAASSSASLVDGYKHRPAPAPPRVAVLRAQNNGSTSSLPGSVLAVDTDAVSRHSKRPLFSARKQRSDSADILEVSLGLESHARAGGVTPGADVPLSDPLINGVVRGVAEMHVHPDSATFIERTASPSPLIPDAASDSQAKPRRKAPPAPPKQRRKPPAPPRVAGVNSMAELGPHSTMQSWAMVGGS